MFGQLSTSNFFSSKASESPVASDSPVNMLAAADGKKASESPVASDSPVNMLAAADGKKVKVDAPQWAAHAQEAYASIREHLVTLALSGLTGVRASIPIFILAIRSKTTDGKAMDLEDGFEWLYSWPCISALSVLLGLELIGDCVPVVSEAMDMSLLLVKPAVAIVIAIAPEYGNEGTAGTVSAAAGCAVLCMLVAVAKSVVTIKVNAEGGRPGAGVLRSFMEDVAVAGLTLLSMGFAVFAAIVVVTFMCLLLSCGCFRGRDKKAKKSPPT